MGDIKTNEQIDALDNWPLEQEEKDELIAHARAANALLERREIQQVNRVERKNYELEAKVAALEGERDFAAAAVKTNYRLLKAAEAEVERLSKIGKADLTRACYLRRERDALRGALEKAVSVLRIYTTGPPQYASKILTDALAEQARAKDESVKWMGSSPDGTGAMDEDSDSCPDCGGQPGGCDTCHPEAEQARAEEPEWPIVTPIDEEPATKSMAEIDAILSAPLPATTPDEPVMAMVEDETLQELIALVKQLDEDRREANAVIAAYKEAKPATTPDVCECEKPMMDRSISSYGCVGCGKPIEPTPDVCVCPSPIEVSQRTPWLCVKCGKEPASVPPADEDQKGDFFGINDHLDEPASVPAAEPRTYNEQKRQNKGKVEYCPECRGRALVDDDGTICSEPNHTPECSRAEPLDFDHEVQLANDMADLPGAVLQEDEDGKVEDESEWPDVIGSAHYDPKIHGVTWDKYQKDLREAEARGKKAAVAGWNAYLTLLTDVLQDDPATVEALRPELTAVIAAHRAGKGESDE